MNREDFFEWLNTCPSNAWLNIGDDVDKISIKFFIDEDEEIDMSDTPTVYIDGEYFPAKWEWHDNDVVSQSVLVLDEEK